MPNDIPDYAITDDIPDYAESIDNKKTGSGLWDKLNTPIVDFRGNPTMQAAATAYQKEHPYLGAAGNFGIDMLSSLTSPLSLGLGGLEGASAAAARMGLTKIAQSLSFPGKVAAGGMVGHGLYNIAAQPTLAGKAGGALEAGLGGLGLRGITGHPVVTEPIIPEVVAERKALPPAAKSLHFPEGTNQPYITKSNIIEQPPSSIFEMPISAKVDVPGYGTPKLELPVKEETKIIPETKSTVVAAPIQVTPKGKEPVKVLFKDTESKELFKTGQLIFSKTEAASSNIQKFAETAKNVATKYGISEVETGKIIGNYNAKIRSLAKESKGSIEPPSFDDFISGNYDTKSTFEIPKENFLKKIGGSEKGSTSINFLTGGTLEPFMAAEKGGISSQKRPLTVPPPDVAPLKQKLITSIKQNLSQATVGRNIQEELYTTERAKRIGAVEGIKTPGLTGYYQQLGALKGELPKVNLEKMKLSQKDVDGLVDAVTNSSLNTWQQINAKQGLVKLLNGITPQKSEIALLNNVFGDDLGQVIELHGGIGIIPTDARRIYNEATNLTKSLMASVDASAPLRQGFPLIHRPEYWSAFKEMWKYGKDEKNYQGLQQAITERPLFERGEIGGLKLTNLSDDLQQREEAFLGTWAEKVPGVRPSERMYVGFINKLRSDTFDSLVREADRLGLKNQDHQIAKYVNVATGRGSLGSLEKAAVELNSVFFSPRLMSSRLTMLNPNYYVKASPFVRKQALRSLLSLTAVGSMVTGLGVAAGGTTSMDSTSADFMKVKFGNTRLDPFAGFQQYFVFGNRLLKGVSSGEDVTGIVKNFLENKLSPVASLIDITMKGDRAFKPSGLGAAVTDNKLSAEVINRVTPMLVGDLVDIYKDDPNLLPLGIPAALGMGVQTYDTPASQNGFRGFNNSFRSFVPK